MDINNTTVAIIIMSDNPVMHPNSPILLKDGGTGSNFSTLYTHNTVRQITPREYAFFCARNFPLKDFH